jgi:hypothetical protein
MITCRKKISRNDSQNKFLVPYCEDSYLSRVSLHEVRLLNGLLIAFLDHDGKCGPDTDFLLESRRAGQSLRVRWINNVHKTDHLVVNTCEII